MKDVPGWEVSFSIHWETDTPGRKERLQLEALRPEHCRCHLERQPNHAAFIRFSKPLESRIDNSSH